MNLEAFIALWKHRYRKYSYIFKQYVLVIIDIFHFWQLKMKHRKPLIAIVRTEHFGDIVAAEPIARQVRLLNPDAYIVWIVKPVFAELVQNHPTINEVWQQPNVLRRILLCNSGIFDQVYNLEFWQSNHDAISNRTHRNPIAEQKNITVFNYLNKGNLLNIFQEIANLPITDDTPRVYISTTDKECVDTLSLPQKFIVVHCNSNYPVKDWSAEKWEKLIQWLIEEKKYKVVEIGLRSKNNIDNQGFIDMCGRLSILQTAEVIRHADYFIGIDSGPAHLANAVKTYGILLFGKLDHFENYTIYSGNYNSTLYATIIKQGSRTCADMDYEYVHKTIDELFINRANEKFLREKKYT